MRGLKGVVMAMTLAGLLGSLIGCNDKVPVYEDTSALENPPPKPPNCPDLPELKNITLKDGTIADVRIVQVLNTKFYFPAELMDRYFLDKKSRWGGFLLKSDLLDFNPDIHAVECPGLVHRFLPEKQVFVSNFGYRDHSSRRKNISSDSDIMGMNFGEVDSRKFGGSYNSWMTPMPEIGVEFGIRKFRDFKSGEFISKVKSKSVTEFVEWLATPPAKRDNERVFTLKVDGDDSDK